MNKALRTLLMFLHIKRYWGKRHTPEKRIIVSKTKYLNRLEKKNLKMNMPVSSKKKFY